MKQKLHEKIEGRKDIQENVSANLTDCLKHMISDYCIATEEWMLEPFYGAEAGLAMWELKVKV